MTAEQLDALRRPAFAIAYRMLGSIGDAEDVVQEGLLRLHRARAAGERIDSPRAYLSTVVSRLALEQRAAFLLREVFDETYARIAEIVGTSEQNARQLAARARRHVEERRPRFEADRAHRDELAARFFAAVEEGDLAGLERLLAHDVALHGDGGGKAPAIARAIHGRVRVAQTLLAWMRAGDRVGGVTVRREEVNGQPGALILDREGRLVSVMILDVAEGRIQGVNSIVNPDKLRHLGPVADVNARLRDGS
jgi:RNA polymerase sigma-70 factor (ECF subfamily)